MWFTWTKECTSRILLENIPSYLFLKLESVLSRVGRLNRLLRGPHSQEVTVYDLVNVGPRRRFSVLGDRRMIVSNCVQSTGHDFLILFGHLLRPRLEAAGLDWFPLFWDFHDEMVIEVRREQAEQAVRIFKETEEEWNAMIGGTIPLRMNPIVINNLADAKVE